MNVLMSARRTTVDVLNSASAAAGTLTKGINIVHNAAAVAEAHSEAWLENTRAVLKDDNKRSLTRRRIESAMNDARFYADLRRDLDSDPEFASFFDQCIKELEDIDVSVKMPSFKQLAAAE